MRATGMTDEDLGRPFIAICNSFNEVIPGHVHLNRVAALIKEEVRKAGGTPVEFNLPGVCEYVVEEGLVGHNWEEILGPVKVLCPSIGECQG